MCIKKRLAVCIKKRLVSTGEGGGSGRRAGAQISWSVLKLTPAPEEDFTGDEKMNTYPR